MPLSSYELPFDGSATLEKRRRGLRSAATDRAPIYVDDLPADSGTFPSQPIENKDAGAVEI